MPINAPQRPTRVLVVDDNDDVRQSLKILLERAGYEVVVAPNGTRAIASQRERMADVLITDILMPEGDGLETIQWFRQKFPAVKIIAMSGGGERLKGEQYLSTAGIAGADALLRKPFEMDVLLKTLGDVLASKTQ